MTLLRSSGDLRAAPDNGHTIEELLSIVEHPAWRAFGSRLRRMALENCRFLAEYHSLNWVVL